MKILVIGASGLLAGPVIRKLEDQGFELRLFSRSVNPSMFVNEYEIVRGDLFNRDELESAMSGCDAVHITISTPDEAAATAAILKAAGEKGIRLISMVSGCTVREENRWFKFTDSKFRAEQMIIQSGIPYLIFRPTWFFESLELMVRNGKAMILGHQTALYHWIAADDFGKMVAYAYSSEEAKNNIFYIYGSEKRSLKEMLERYVSRLHPEIKKVSTAPIPVLKIIAFLTRNVTLKYAASLFSYFEKVEEPEIPERELNRLGKAEIDFETWLTSKRN